MTPESMQYLLFLDFIRSISRPPKHTLVLVIDTLDKCGSPQSRPELLRSLIDAVMGAPWLKVIITSRLEVDIQDFFNRCHLKSLCIQYDICGNQGRQGK
jgi:hypothetical protein